MSGGAKQFRLVDVILSVICVVFVAEAIAPAAAIGNSQFFWWVFLIIAFLLPYGLVVSELGTTYSDDEGGLYDWVRRAFGDTWAARVAWYYWINFPLWMASLAVLFPSTVNAMTGRSLGTVPSLVISLVFIWAVVFLSFSRASDSIWIMNLAAVLKVGIAVVVGGLGIYYALSHGFASDMSPSTFLPSFDTGALTYLSIILFNFMGFEVVATYASDMKDPKTQIPKAIIWGGLAIAIIYMVSSFGMGVAIPSSELSLDSGVMDAVGIMAGAGSILLVLVGIVFLVTLVGNMVSWAFGVNFVVVCAAQDGNLPRPLASVTRSSRMPKGASIANGVIASILVAFLPVANALGISDLFWMLFSVNVVFILLSYIPIFPAFLKLRRVDAEARRVFRVPGAGILLRVIVWLPVILVVLAVLATIVPLSGSADEMTKLPGLVAVVVFLVLGEAVRIISGRRSASIYRGMETDGDPMPRAELVATDGEGDSTL
ncbi:APC family permease [Actinomyces ruminicola]|uniref:Agmatine:putrescine antiporter, APC superfamily (TC 2.A.3) n=1 Tax=Actinomyces ruminicola TaxID=332524 RepID=A0A1G9W941_9ACTO|nr:APC family permease [Actinomyces ruminicola]SDM80525.1 agmatine:putrescine antiporter, APC superfamily (TC 2.A.3) [Actinomyces ruminicola]